MFKFIFTLIFSAYFILGQSGFEVTMHHCMGQTSYAVLGIEFHQTCSCIHDNNGNLDNCCHSEKINFKIKTDDPIPATLSILSTPIFSLITVIPFEEFDKSGISVSYASLSYPEKAPPGKYTPIFIFDRTLLI